MKGRGRPASKRTAEQRVCCPPCNTAPGEQKVSEGENGRDDSYLTPVAAAPGAASTAAWKAGDAAPTATTTPTGATTADATADDSDDCAGAEDTHVVAFEGARDQIIVVAKKSAMQQWLFSDDANVIIRRAHKTFMLTPTFAVSGFLSTVGLQVALAHGIEDKRWYWIFVCGGAWLPLVRCYEASSIRLLAASYTHRQAG